MFMIRFREVVGSAAIIEVIALSEHGSQIA
jgi:hypothetical protein